MTFYDYKCSACGYIIENKYYSSYKNAPQAIICNKCGKQAEKLFPRVAIQVKEETGTGDSTKPGSYWRNAEANRQRNVEKQKKEQAEKEHYKDPETMQRKEQLKRREKRLKNEQKQE